MGNDMAKNVVVVGTQWGDEGKGKIVDWLTDQAGGVVRFQGGHNAGHTLVVGKDVYKLNLVPSGIVRKGVVCYIGNGVVLDAHHLLEEIQALFSGTLIFAFAILLFRQAEMLTGGTAGLAFLAYYVSDLPFGLLYFLINRPF